MKRTVTLVAALGLLVGACSADESDSTTTTVEETADASTDATSLPPSEPTVASTDGTDDEADGTAEASDDAAQSDEQTTGDATDVDSGDEIVDPAVDDGEIDDGDAVTIRSLDDIPPDCRDAMGDFLRSVEPIVSEIDWQTASLNDFQAIGEEFTEKSDEFDAEAAELGCGNLDFTGGNEFDLLVEFAEEEAPGVVGFLEFLGLMQGSTGGAAEQSGGSAAGDAFETCDDGVAFIRGLVDEYDSVGDVPAPELGRLQDLTAVIATCPPGDLEFLQDPAVVEFFSGTP